MNLPGPVNILILLLCAAVAIWISERIIAMIGLPPQIAWVISVFIAIIFLVWLLTILFGVNLLGVH